MRRIIAIIMVLSLAIGVCSGLTSCAPSLSDEEARAILEEKLPISYYVMGAVYGDLLKVENEDKIDESWTTPHYFKVVPGSHYTTIAEIKADAEKVFAPTYLETMYEYAFTGSEETMSRFGESEGVLTVDVVKKPYGVMTDLYIDTAVVVKSTRYAAKIEIMGSLDEGKTKRVVEINLACVDGVWLFNGPTY